MTSLHPAEPTDSTATRERRPDEAIVPYETVATSVHALIAAQAENQRQELLVFNPSREVDSIVEHIEERLKQDPELIALVREWVASNRRERVHVHGATGQIDLVARTLAVRPDRQGLGIKRAAAMLREPLKVIRAARTEVVEFKTYYLACCSVKDVVGQVPVATLRGPGMGQRLGNDLHGVLCDLLTDGAS